MSIHLLLILRQSASKHGNKGCEPNSLNTVTFQQLSKSLQQNADKQHLGSLICFFFYSCYWNIKTIRVTSRCFPAQISKCLYAKQTLSRQDHARFRTVNFRLCTCCWAPHALSLHMSLNLPYKVLFSTTKKEKNFNSSKFHSRDCVIA